MGYFSGWGSKEDLVEYLENNFAEGYTPLKHSLVGNNLWSLIRKEETQEVFVSLSKLGCNAGDWGYKPMDETMGPYAYDCPITFLNKVTAPVNDSSEKWRERVRKFHEMKKARVYAKDQVWKNGDMHYRLLEKAGPRLGWNGFEMETGKYYRLPFKFLHRSQRVIGKE